MKVVKPLVLAFLFGGIFSIVGQAFTLLWVNVLGPESMLIGFAILVSMGILGALMFIFGWHQPIAKIAGFGAILPFNGFCAAIADAYLNAAQETGSAGNGVAAALKLVAIVLGFGCLLILIVAACVYFLLGGVA